MPRHGKGDRRARMQRIGQVLPKDAKKAFRKHGFAEGSVIRHWKEIAGGHLSACSLPLKLSRPRGKKAGGATLHLLVESAAALEVQHQIPLLIEKLNIFYGYPAIARIALIQGRVARPEKKERRTPPPPDERARRKAERWTREIRESGLKTTLVGLGEAILRSGEN